MTEPTSEPAQLAAIRELAADVVCELTRSIGDHAGVDQALLRWIDRLDSDELALVSLAALQQVFVNCLRIDRDGVTRYPLTRGSAAKEGAHR